MLKHILAILAFAISVNIALANGAEELERLCNEAEAASKTGDFTQAATLWEQAGQLGLEGGRLHYNLGNAYARQGRYGLSIGHYLKAQEIMPGNLDLNNNLRYVRTLREDQFDAPESARVMKTLFFWHYDIPRHIRLQLALWALPLLCIAACVLLWRRPKWLLWTAAALAVWCLAFGVSIFLQDWSRSHSPTAVVIAAEVHPRKGDDNRYANAFSAPLHDGAEVVITRRRGGWSEIRLPNGLTGWLEDSDLMTI